MRKTAGCLRLLGWLAIFVATVLVVTMHVFVATEQRELPLPRPTSRLTGYRPELVLLLLESPGISRKEKKRMDAVWLLLQRPDDLQSWSFALSPGLSITTPSTKIMFNASFWEAIEPSNADKVLVFQSDSVMCGSGDLDDFLEYDYIGAPWKHRYGSSYAKVAETLCEICPPLAAIAPGRCRDFDLDDEYLDD
ncbi:hypothetical protein FOZ60_001563 [Perkinsus olseni]|uniref:DUF5672 domain-containing protein n=1 Tax=Perkinsus olseni TaxID=32597 RepID=A0A7J6P058_PEROL|nr:hypothetical protein FOZ60_001563 [Perkinsus olseni]